MASFRVRSGSRDAVRRKKQGTYYRNKTCKALGKTRGSRSPKGGVGRAKESHEPVS